MKAQPDFMSQKSIFQEYFDQSANDMVYLRKLHCELIRIEQNWMHSKHYYKDNDLFAPNN